ncbi:MAG: fructosamine kinase family protein [Phycisphaerales bacterium]|nr:fructosamine kinase family protein [Phycisphaerales bacterium]
MTTPPLQQVADALGTPVTNATPLGGGCVADVWRLRTTAGTIVAKVDRSPRPGLDLEAHMLRYLAEHSRLPVPRVLHADPRLLLMQDIPSGGRRDRRAEEDAARHLAALHDLTPPTGRGFGLDFDTLIGTLPQPNPWTDTWVGFFRDHRLRFMADQARLPAPLRARIDTLADRLPDLLPEPAHPSLVHGDIWGGNVLVGDGRINAFIDPAIHYAHAEVELAFITLFNTFGETFFNAYHQRRPIAPGFFEERRDLYNLYPLLVHATLFGGGYVSQVDHILRRFT